MKTNILKEEEISKLREMKTKYAPMLKKGGVRAIDTVSGLSLILLSEILEELKKLNEKPVEVEVEDEKPVITPKKTVAKKTTQVKE